MLRAQKIIQMILAIILALGSFLLSAREITITFNQTHRSLYIGSPAKKLNYYYGIVGGRDQQSITAQPTEAIIAIHGYPHDVTNTLNAVYNAASSAHKSNILLVAPIFQVTASSAKNCAKAFQSPASDDIQWTCNSWISGGIATNSTVSSFQALDNLVLEVVKQWPSVVKLTIVGFSAGAQMTQHYIGFSAINNLPQLKINYVVASPGSWLYFDPFADRYLYIKSFATQPAENIVDSCTNVNRWKYGLDDMPSHLVDAAQQAKVQYQNSNIAYLAGGLDNGNIRGAHYAILDKSCAASAQGGNSRLQRAKAYMAYLRGLLKLDPIFEVAPHCAHDVNCVLTSTQGVNMLFNQQK